MRVAEVVVRFAGTTLDVTHVRAGGSYRIGTAPGVELPVELGGITAFPIVDATGGACVVRRPAGTIATYNGRVLEAPEVQLSATDRIEMSLGNLLVSIELVALPQVTVPRRKPDHRLASYAGGALLVHLAVWGTAVTFSTPRGVAKRRPIVQARVAPVRIRVREAVPPPRPDPTAKPPAFAIANRSGPSRPPGPDHAKPKLESTSPPATMADSVARLDAAIAGFQVQTQLDLADSLYREDDVHEGDFGKVHAFDPSTRPGFDTIKTGPYQTISSGREAGDSYDLAEEHARVHVRFCDDDACTAEGGLKRADVDNRLAYKLRQFAACYDADAPSLTLAFEVDAEGRVHDAHGPGKAGDCVSKLANAIAFPPSHDETRVSYSMVFVPPFGS